MNDDEKLKLDGWKSLRDHAWHEFQDKSRAEWRLSFSVWGAILSCVAAIATNKASLPPIHPWIAAGALGVVILSHWVFLVWIQTKLKEARGELLEAHNAIRSIIGSEPRSKRARRTWKQRSLWVQVFISLLLALVLLYLLQGACK